MLRAAEPTADASATASLCLASADSSLYLTIDSGSGAAERFPIGGLAGEHRERLSPGEPADRIVLVHQERNAVARDGDREQRLLFRIQLARGHADGGFAFERVHHSAPRAARFDGDHGTRAS